MVSPPLDPDRLLPELVGDRYRIGRELGRGGMARVYLAHDEKHRRDVAIKVIRPELSASLGHDRFLREIEIAARLRHPNIVPLYDSGEVSGSLYFVMPYEEGSSLRERLAQGGEMPIPEALNVLRDVARALAYAHEHGVVHRDVKPDNVMLSGGAAVVTDFGIAKAVSVAMKDASGPTLTQSGSSIGTPAYMAPEQATGDPSIDHRADIYSFGCLAYEIFTGNPPFPGQSMHLVIAAHLATVPRPVTALRTDVPAAVGELIARCLEKDPAERPQSARDLLDALGGAATPATPVSLAVAAPARRPSRSVLWVGLAMVAALIGTVTFLTTRASGGSAPITLAVLPFGKIGADTAMDFVAGGLAEEVATALARVPGIQIKSRSGARAYEGKLTVDVAEAGARLKADYVMTGVVRQERGRWTLSADVARAADATSLWGEDFNLTPAEAAGAAEAIARNLIAALRREFPKAIGAAPGLTANQRTSNNEAYRLYLRGQDMLDRRGPGFAASADLFREAIHLDTLFAPAYAGLSMALALVPYGGGTAAKDLAVGVADAARRALALDSTLTLPHVALGLAYQHDYQWDSAEAEFQTAIRLDGRNVEGRTQYGRHLLFRGRPAEGLRQLREARAEDPASAAVLSWLSFAYYLNHEIDSALVESRRALENDSTNATSRGLGALVRLGANLPEEARKLIDRSNPNLPASAYVIAKLGDTALVRKRLRELDAQTSQYWNVETRRTYAYLGLGDTARALSALERATAAKEIWPSVHGAYAPMYDSVRESARFQALLRRVGLLP
jgi:TolB-like protein/Tfp pilus assembly protein PilF